MSSIFCISEVFQMVPAYPVFFRPHNLNSYGYVNLLRVIFSYLNLHLQKSRLSLPLSAPYFPANELLFKPRLRLIGEFREPVVARVDARFVLICLKI
jgi:hypothetical protein